MTLQERKISFVQEFLRLQNEEVINNLETILKDHKISLFDKEIEPMSIKQFKQEIDEALVDSENNNVISVAELQAKYNK